MPPKKKKQKVKKRKRSSGAGNGKDRSSAQADPKADNQNEHNESKGEGGSSSDESVVPFHNPNRKKSTCRIKGGYWRTVEQQAEDGKDGSGKEAEDEKKRAGIEEAKEAEDEKKRVAVEEAKDEKDGCGVDAEYGKDGSGKEAEDEKKRADVEKAKEAEDGKKRAGVEEAKDEKNGGGEVAKDGKDSTGKDAEDENKKAGVEEAKEAEDGKTRARVGEASDEKDGGGEVAEDAKDSSGKEAEDEKKRAGVGEAKEAEDEKTRACVGEAKDLPTEGEVAGHEGVAAGSRIVEGSQWMQEYLAKQGEISEELMNTGSWHEMFQRCVDATGNAEAKEGEWAPDEDYFKRDNAPYHPGEFVMDYRSCNGETYRMGLFGNPAKIFFSDASKKELYGKDNKFKKSEAAKDAVDKMNEVNSYYGTTAKVVTCNDGRWDCCRKGKYRHAGLDPLVDECAKHLDRMPECTLVDGAMVYPKKFRGQNKVALVCEPCWRHNRVNIVGTGRFGLFGNEEDKSRQVGVQPVECFPHGGLCPYRMERSIKYFPLSESKLTEVTEIPLPVLFGPVFDRVIEFAREVKVGEGENGEIMFPGNEVKLGSDRYSVNSVVVPCHLKPLMSLMDREKLFYCRVRCLFFEMNFGPTEEFSGLEEKYFLGYAYSKADKTSYRLPHPPSVEVNPHLALGPFCLESHGCPRKETMSVLRRESAPEGKELEHGDMHYLGTVDAEDGHTLLSNPRLKDKLIPWSFIAPLQDSTMLKIASAESEGGSEVVKAHVGQVIRVRHDVPVGGVSRIGPDLGVHLQVSGSWFSKLHKYKQDTVEHPVDIPQRSKNQPGDDRVEPVVELLVENVTRMSPKGNVKAPNEFEGMLEDIVQKVEADGGSFDVEFAAKLHAFGDRLKVVADKVMEGKGQKRKNSRELRKEARDKKKARMNPTESPN